jgi:hypothetical protein
MVRHTSHLSLITHNLFYSALDSHPVVAMALRRAVVHSPHDELRLRTWIVLNLFRCFSEVTFQCHISTRVPGCVPSDFVERS